jgi:hypothetical protein
MNMPYKLSTKGFDLIHANTAAGQRELQGLTDMQRQALDYLNAWVGATSNNEGPVYVDSAEVAKYYGYPNGQYFRGVLASLHNKGLVDKKEGA